MKRKARKLILTHKFCGWSDTSLKVKLFRSDSTHRGKRSKTVVRWVGHESAMRGAGRVKWPATGAVVNFINKQAESVQILVYQFNKQGSREVHLSLHQR